VDQGVGPEFKTQYSQEEGERKEEKTVRSQRKRSGRSRLEASPGKQFTRPYFEKNHHKKWLVE
jgi:hypothetical protein